MTFDQEYTKVLNRCAPYERVIKIIRGQEGQILVRPAIRCGVDERTDHAGTVSFKQIIEAVNEAELHWQKIDQL